jgi:hypothetical protein
MLKASSKTACTLNKTKASRVHTALQQVGHGRHQTKFAVWLLFVVYVTSALMSLPDPQDSPQYVPHQRVCINTLNLHSSKAIRIGRAIRTTGIHSNIAESRQSAAGCQSHSDRLMRPSLSLQRHAVSTIALCCGPRSAACREAAALF